MQVINLSKKKVVHLNLNGKICLMCLDTLAIDHFQRTNKIGLNEAIERMQKGEVNIVYKFVCSFIREKKTGQILGHNYFKQFDELGLLNTFQPVILDLLSNDIPKAKNETEKK